MRTEMKWWQFLLWGAFGVWCLILGSIGLDGLTRWWGELWGSTTTAATLTLIAVVAIWWFTHTPLAERRAAEERRIRELVREELRKTSSPDTGPQ